MTTKVVRWRVGAGLALALALAPMPARADEASGDEVASLSDLSIEELSQLEVTSVSKRAEPLSGAPAAIYVLTNDDILRSPANSLPELLREAPNLQVQRLDARQYAISARGFNGYESANKLLALIDGRSIYTTLFSGILWELHAPMLEDLQQIEVTSGPGGTLYGPNAVNGIINIQSKSARDTLGLLARATAGANEQTAALRYGMPIGDGAVRLYANWFNRDGLPDGTGAAVDDHFSGIQGGFRMDLGDEASAITLQGDVFDTSVDTARGDGEKGHNLLARWTRQLDGDSSLRIQGYYDDYKRRFTLVTDSLETFDVEAQYNRREGRHDLVLGIGGRTTKDAFINRLNPFVLDPERKRLWIGNAFVQDRFALSDTFSVTAGLKLEQSSFSGLELLPNLRLAWQPSERMLLWGAVSRAVRTPSRIDRQLVFPPLLVEADDFDSEKLTAFEAGYRGQPGRYTSLSVNVFFNLYDDLRTTEYIDGVSIPIQLMNNLKGESYGIEAWATQQVTPWWRLRLGLATYGDDFDVRRGRVDLANRASIGNSPDFNIVARSQMNLTDRLDFELGARAVDDVEQLPADGYVEVDARLGYRISDNVELYVAGMNLLHARHAESGDPGRAQLVQRSVFAGTRLRF